MRGLGRCPLPAGRARAALRAGRRRRPEGRSRCLREGAALAPLCHGGRAALGPAGDLSAGRCVQGAGAGAAPGERG